MPRLKLDHKKEYIQLVIDPEDKAALEAWWAANDTSMSDVIARRLLQSAATVHSNGDESQHLGAIAITTTKKADHPRN